MGVQRCLSLVVGLALAGCAVQSWQAPLRLAWRAPQANDLKEDASPLPEVSQPEARPEAPAPGQAGGEAAPAGASSTAPAESPAATSPEPVGGPAAGDASPPPGPRGDADRSRCPQASPESAFDSVQTTESNQMYAVPVWLDELLTLSDRIPVRHRETTVTTANGRLVTFDGPVGVDLVLLGDGVRLRLDRLQQVFACGDMLVLEGEHGQVAIEASRVSHAELLRIRPRNAFIAVTVVFSIIIASFVGMFFMVGQELD
jgi:hypothetical protein